MTHRPRSQGLLLVQCPFQPGAIWPHAHSSALVCHAGNKTKDAIHHRFQQLVSLLNLKEKFGNHKAGFFFSYFYIFSSWCQNKLGKERGPMERKGKQSKRFSAQWPHTAMRQIPRRGRCCSRVLRSRGPAPFCFCERRLLSETQIGSPC